MDDELIAIKTTPVITPTLFVCAKDPCNQLYVRHVDYSTWDGSCPDCPRCAKQTTQVNSASDYTTCTMLTCSQYLSTVAAADSTGRCEGKRTDKHGACNVDLIALDDDVVADLPDDEPAVEENNRSGPERRLLAAMGRATRWVRSSGTHHRSTGGSHTSAAQEKHSKAHQSKAQVRDSMVAQLKVLIEEVRKSSKPDLILVKDAENVCKQVSAK